MPTYLSRLRERLGEVHDVGSAAQLLGWDQQVLMPPAGAESRAEALSTLERIGHELFTAKETGEVLEGAAKEVADLPEDSDDVRLVHNTLKDWEKARRVPTALAAEMARAHVLGETAWERTRAENDFEAFSPYLERNVELAQRYAACFDTFDTPYDALLDDFEPGLTTAVTAETFDALKTEIVPLVARLSELDPPAALHGSFPLTAQRRLVRDVIGLMGFDDNSWRIDDSVHPFQSSPGVGDVRITSRFYENDLGFALYSAMHESGHGLYEEGVPASLARTPLGNIASYAMHESQSRMWENVVGRSRAFCEVLAPRLRAAFPETLSSLDPESLYRAVNNVQRSLIRIEADEASYGLHIVLRFELEQELISGNLSVRDLPEAWAAKTDEYLGLAVPDHVHGVMQDVHWPGGLFGYFPSYALGNLIAAQLWAKVREQIPDLEGQIAAGELSGLREWLRQNVHRHGSKFTTAELLERVVGGPLDVAPFAEYLRTKLGDVYQLDLETSS